MALPSSVNRKTRTGLYMDTNGDPVTGTVEFTIPGYFTIPEEDIFTLPRLVVANIVPGASGYGEMSQELICGDDPDISVQFTYLVTHKFNGGITPIPPFNIQVSISDPTTSSLEDDAPVAPVLAGTAYVTSAQLLRRVRRTVEWNGTAYPAVASAELKEFIGPTDPGNLATDRDIWTDTSG